MVLPGPEASGGANPRSRRFLEGRDGGGVMRLRPRTVKGVCLLAFVEWVGGCAVAWWILPPQPRADWHDVPPIAWARVVLPDSETTFLVAPLASALPPAPNTLMFWNSATGQTHELFSDEDDLPAFA